MPFASGWLSSLLARIFFDTVMEMVMITAEAGEVLRSAGEFSIVGKKCMLSILSSFFLLCFLASPFI